MHERFGLRRGEALDEKCLFDLATLPERHFRRGFHRINGSKRRQQAALLLARILASSGEDGGILLGRAKFVVAFARLQNWLSRELLSKSDCACQQISVDELVDEAESQRPFSGDGIAFAAHLDRLGHAREPRQPLCPRSARDDAELHFGLTNLRASNGNAIVASHGSFHPAAQCRPVNSGDDGLAAIFDFQEQRKQTGSARLSRGHLFQLLDVRTGNESAAASDQHGGFQSVVLLQLVDGIGNSLGHAGTQSVDRRVVDGDDADVAGLCELNKIAHDRL